MDLDVISRFRPIRGTREAMKVDANKLYEVAKVWVDVIDEILGCEILDPPRAWTMPRGFDELTYLIVTCCDELPGNINPAGFTGGLLHAQKLAAGDGRSFTSLADCKVRAVATYHRMLRCVDRLHENGRTPQSATALEAIAGEDFADVLEIANSDMNADDRMREICRFDARVLGWNSLRWSQVLGVSDAAIRRTQWWRVERHRIINRREDDE